MTHNTVVREDRPPVPVDAGLPPLVDSITATATAASLQQAPDHRTQTHRLDQLDLTKYMFPHAPPPMAVTTLAEAVQPVTKNLWHVVGAAPKSKLGALDLKETKSGHPCCLAMWCCW